MAMKCVYVIKIKPKEYSNHVQLAYLFRPNKKDVIDSLNNILSKVSNNHYSEFIKKCIIGIDMYDLPVLREEERAVKGWRYPGDSQYNNKGQTSIEIIKAYEK